jgi:serine/threonine-protein kinase
VVASASPWSGPAFWVAIALAVVASVEAALLVVLYARPASDLIELRSPRAEAVRTLAAPVVPPEARQAALDALTAVSAATARTEAAPPPADPAAAAAPAPAGPRFGGITVSTTIPLKVFKGGQLIGSTSGPIAVNEGTHTFELVNEELGFRLPQSVTIKSGQMTSLNIAVPNGRVSINAVPWAEVTIDGTPAGQTPLANLSLPIGTHEIVFRHPQFGERRQTIVVKVDGLTRVSQTFQDRN